IILAIHAVLLGGDLQRYAHFKCDLDGAVDPLLGANSPQKRKILSTPIAGRKTLGQTVIDIANPVGPAQRFALAVTDGDHGHFSILSIQRNQARKIQASVKGGVMRETSNPRKWKRQRSQ